ncbi:AEC family transporter [Nodosilinea sp. LEGE 07088]|uniref:AEC family transporter n=1 Tax=Nodosilinea sp. LEGE 07088 TaxID=2777968 RepID=UPI00187EC758|nr:AEC family transporter [Nodosilinea sp. LEGE 07088]MBE9138786.1 AEC family transporter [Nodosilinea sp. LEGE 07088]
MLIQIVSMALVCCIGYGFRRVGLLGPGEAKTIGLLLTHLALPAVVLKALATATITADLIYLPIAALLVVIPLTLIAVIAARWLKWPRPKAGALVTTFPTCEGGAVGYPLMLLAFGEVGLSRIVLFDLAQGIYLLTVVYCLSAWYGNAGITVRAIAHKLLQTPFFWAIVLGLIVNRLGLVNDLLLGLLDIAGGSFLLLVLLLLGMEFQVQRRSVGRYGLIALAKIGCGLGLGWLATLIFGLTGVERAAVLVGASLPPSMLTLLFTQENNLDSGFAIGLISVAVPLYLLVMAPLLTGMSP